MASTINTNGLNVNYPVPGINNNSQGFRNNFQNIKTNLDVASAEITDLQDSVVVKNSIGNAAIENDMGNVLISNCATLGFRATTYNLGSALTGPVLVNLALADVHYGTLAGNILLGFGNWAPTGTLSKVTLNLSTSNANANYNISFPSAVVVTDNNSGGAILNNFINANGTPTITFPYDVTKLNLECYSTDCGNTIYVTPINRPFQSVQIQTRTPPSTGDYGDTNGTVCVDAAATQLIITSSLANDFFVTSNTSTLYTGMPVVFTGTSFEANIVSGTTYYVGNIANSTSFTVSANANAVGNVNLSGSTGNMDLNPVTYMYIASNNFNGNVYNLNITSITSPNIISVSDSSSFVSVNGPVIFTGNASGNTGNVTLNKVYYIRSTTGGPTPNITISQNRFDGVAGAEVKTLTTVSTGNVDIDVDVYVGPDIFRRVPLQSF